MYLSNLNIMSDWLPGWSVSLCIVIFPSVNLMYLWSSTYTFKSLIFICLNIYVCRCLFRASCGIYSGGTYFESRPCFRKYIFTSILEKKCGLIRHPSTVSRVRGIITATSLHTSIFPDATNILWLSVKESLTRPW
jgi:hypothetical protein